MGKEDALIAFLENARLRMVHDSVPAGFVNMVTRKIEMIRKEKQNGTERVSSTCAKNKQHKNQ